MKLLIAGYGDLGRTLAQTCQTTPGWQNATVLAIRRQPPAETPQNNVLWIQADLADLATAETMPDIIAHLTDLTHVVYCAAPTERSEAAYRATYVAGLQNLVDAIKANKLTKTNNANKTTEATADTGLIDLPQLLFVSSTAVYDSNAQGCFDETSPTEPRRFNGQVLLEAENWLLAHWPRALILRLSGIYGPNKQSLLTSIANGTTTVPASPDFIANRIHIEDAARAILHLFDHHEQGVFIGTDSEPMPLSDLYQHLAKLLNAPAPRTGEPSPMMGKKWLLNKKLLSTGFQLKWPNSLQGYQALIAKQNAPKNSH